MRVLLLWAMAAGKVLSDRTPWLWSLDRQALDQGHLLVEFKQPVATTSWTLCEFVIRGAHPQRTSARNWRLQTRQCAAARTGTPRGRPPQAAPSALPAVVQVMGPRIFTKSPPASPALCPAALPLGTKLQPHQPCFRP